MPSWGLNGVKIENSNFTTCSRSCAAKFRGGWVNHHKVDWSAVNRKAYETGSNYVSGGTTKWIAYNNIKVQGTYEVRACEILDSFKNEGKIKDWYYSKTRIKYYYNNEEHTYIIDFTILEKDDTFRYVEVKGRESEVDYAKWSAAKEQGLQLEVWRYKDLFNKVS